MKQKIMVLVIISLLIISFVALPCISATINSYKLKETVALDKDAVGTVMGVTTSDPPWPPLMWTEDFSTFYLSIPGEAGGGYAYYYIDWGDGTVEEWIGPYVTNETVAISHIWDEGAYQIGVRARTQDGDSKLAKYGITLSSDLKFFGVETGYVNITYIFAIYWKDGCDCWIFIDWGDGTGEWIGPYEQPLLFSPRPWSLPGEYVLKIKLKDIYGNESDWITFIITILSIENNPPEPPTITGQTQGKAGTVYEYTFVSIDPDGDNVSYYIDWGDKCEGEWIDEHPSGEEAKASHAFRLPRTFTINALAVDIYGAESDWGTLEVTMPVNQQISYSFFQWFFERFPLLEFLVYSFFDKF